MADETTTLGLKIENKQAIDALKDTSKQLGALGIDGARNLSGLIGALGQIGAVAGTIGIAYMALKKTFELVFDAEQMKAMNKGFEILAENAGLSADKLRDGFAKASNGILSTHDSIKLASDGIIKLGDNADKLPQILELSMKIAKVTGRDLKDVYETLVQGIASGHTRMLKTLGITIDSEKAAQKYADSTGHLKDALTEAGKRQATLNEVLDYGSKKFKGISSDLTPATASFKQFAAALDDIKEIFVMFFESPIFKKFFKNLSEVTGEIKNKLVAAYGEGSEKSAAQLSVLETKLKKQQDALDMVNEGQLDYYREHGKTSATLSSQMNLYQERIQKTRDEINALKTAEDSRKAKAEKPEAVPKEKRFKTEEELKIESEFLAKISEMRLKNIQEMQKLTTDETAFIALQKQEQELLEEQHQAKLSEIQSKYRMSNAQERAMMFAAIAQEDEAYVLRKQLQQESIKKDEAAFFEHRTNMATSSTQGVSYAFQEEGRKARRELSNYGAAGRVVFKSFETNAVSALKEWGAGTKTAAEAAKGFMLGMIADVAEYKGRQLLIMGTAEMNPAAIAGGSALIALSGLIRSQIGGGAGAGSGGSGGGGSDPGGASAGGEQKPEMKETPKKTLTVEFHGPAFVNDEAKRWLMETMRQETDATDFKYTQIT